MSIGRVADILVDHGSTIIVLELFQVLSVWDDHYGMLVLVRRDGETIFAIIPAEVFEPLLTKYALTNF
jgi:hypothetical protein